MSQPGSDLPISNTSGLNRDPEPHELLTEVDDYQRGLLAGIEMGKHEAETQLEPQLRRWQQDAEATRRTAAALADKVRLVEGTIDRTFRSMTPDEMLWVLLNSACYALEAEGFNFDLNPALGLWWRATKNRRTNINQSEEDTTP